MQNLKTMVTKNHKTQKYDLTFFKHCTCSTSFICKFHSPVRFLKGRQPFKLRTMNQQVIKKDESIYQPQINLQDCKKELSIVKGILPKVSEERDMLWEKYRENNRLLSSEITMLKKKVEALDEDVLMKEGQITILKDALEKPFDLLSSPVLSEGFLLR